MQMDGDELDVTDSTWLWPLLEEEELKNMPSLEVFGLLRNVTCTT